MRRLILLIAFLLISSASFADNSQRKISSGAITESQSIKSSAGTVYGLYVEATAANGYAVIVDYAGSTIADLPSYNELVEAREATQFNSKFVNIEEDGIKAYNGIYLYLQNATAVVYYY